MIHQTINNTNLHQIEAKSYGRIRKEGHKMRWSISENYNSQDFQFFFIVQTMLGISNVDGFPEWLDI